MRVEWRNLEAVQTKRKTVEVRDVMSEARDKLEMKVKYVHLVWLIP